jgi:hypothetical protein
MGNQAFPDGSLGYMSDTAASRVHNRRTNPPRLLQTKDRSPTRSPAAKRREAFGNSVLRNFPIAVQVHDEYRHACLRKQL